MFKAPIGMKDILPEELFAWQEVEKQARITFSLFGYSPISTPILENLKLFNRSLGNETEIVKKQMFVVKREDEDYCLRPEGTAAIVRAYLENNLDKTTGFAKLYYIGPMFRAERPQKGRLRQFHHIGVEALGSNSPYLDSEIIILAVSILKNLKVEGFQLKINSLGCLKDKEKLSLVLREKLKDKSRNLCEDCQERLNRNVFRVLDCKNNSCKEVVSGLNLAYNDYLCKDCQEHFENVKENLNSLNISYECVITLVRGLDYYSRTVFEITHSSLGAQDAIGAGGRYDHLIHELGGPESGAAGFALGVERLLLVSKYQPVASFLDTFIITLGKEAKKNGFVLLNNLRANAISADMDFEDKSLKSQMRKANDSKAKFCAIIGEDELKKQVVTLKNMQDGKQEEIPLANFIEEIKKRINSY